MNVVINQSVIKEIFSDRLKDEIIAYLNQMIDEELEKENMDTDLIDECIDTIDKIQNDDILPALRIALTEKELLKYCKKHTEKNSTAKRTIAACLIVAVCSSVMLVNSDTAFAVSARELFSEIISALNLTADESPTTPAKEISSIYLVFPKEYSFRVKSKKDIDLSGVTVIAVYKDKSESVVPLSKCTVNIKENFNNDQNSVLAVIGYEGCAVSVMYETEE